MTITYIIKDIHPESLWYSTRKQFKGKLVTNTSSISKVYPDEKPEWVKCSVRFIDEQHFHKDFTPVINGVLLKPVTPKKSITL